MRERPQPGLNLEERAFGSCVLCREDFVHAVRHEPKTAWLIRAASVLGSLSIAGGVALLLRGDRQRWGFGLLAFGLLCFAVHNAPEHIAERWFSRTPKEARELRYTLGPEGLIVASALSRQLYLWPSLHGFHRTAEALLVWVSSGTFLIIPVRAFSEADLPKVLARLEQEVGPPPAPIRLASYLLATAVCAAAALWAWERFSPR